MKKNIKGWKYYNLAAVPTCAPHEDVDISPIVDGTIWSLRSENGSKPLLARYITDFDCKEETSYWNIVKDGPFNIDELSKKYQKCVGKALERTEVKMVDPRNCLDELYDVYQACFKTYESADNEMTKDAFIFSVSHDGREYWAAYCKDSGQMCGWMACERHSDWTETCVAKYHPDLQSHYRPSDAIHYTILSYYLNELGHKYVNSGTRNINHKTNVQDYKVKHWNFRYAYSKLHIVYNPRIKWLITISYPFRRVLSIFDNITIVHQITSLLRMEEIVRNDKH